MTRRLIDREESLDIGGGFSITRASKRGAEVLMVEIHPDGVRCRGEGLPYHRLGETLDTVAAQIKSLRKQIKSGSLTRAQLQTALRPGAARSALDCALWDIEAKRRMVPVWQLACLPEPKPLVTAFTIGLDKPAAMTAMAAENTHRALLKLSLGEQDDLARVRAVRAARPDAELIVDANDSWTPVAYAEYARELSQLRIRPWSSNRCRTAKTRPSTPSAAPFQSAPTSRCTTRRTLPRPGGAATTATSSSTRRAA